MVMAVRSMTAEGLRGFAINLRRWKKPNVPLGAQAAPPRAHRHLHWVSTAGTVPVFFIRQKPQPTAIVQVEVLEGQVYAAAAWGIAAPDAAALSASARTDAGRSTAKVRYEVWPRTSCITFDTAANFGGT